MGFVDTALENGRSLFIFFLAILLILAVLDGLTTQFESSPIADNVSKEAVVSVRDQAYSGLDIGFLVLAVGLIIVGVLLSLSKASNPAWFIGICIGVVVVLALLLLLGVVYNRILDITVFAGIIGSLKFIPYIMSHLLEYGILFATVISISLFAGRGDSQ